MGREEVVSWAGCSGEGEAVQRPRYYFEKQVVSVVRRGCEVQPVPAWDALQGRAELEAFGQKCIALIVVLNVVGAQPFLVVPKNSLAPVKAVPDLL